MCIESLCTPSQHIKEGNLAAHVAMPSVPSPNEIVVAQQTVKNEENARYSLTANSVNLTRDLGSILRPSQDKSLLVISIIRKRLGLNRIVGNFDGKSPFFLYERPSRAHVVNTGEALRPRKARQNLSKQTARSCFIGVMIANARSKERRACDHHGSGRTPYTSHRRAPCQGISEAVLGG